MLLKLYEDGFVNYHALLTKFYKQLDMTELELVVMLKVLDLYRINKKVRNSKVASELGMKKQDVEVIINNLMIKKIYSITIETNENGLTEEKVSLESLFNKVEDCYKSETLLKVESDLKELIASFEREFNRTLTPYEYNIIEEFVTKDGFTIPEIKSALKKAVMQQKITLSYIEQLLLKSRRKTLGDVEENSLDASTKKNLDKAMLF